MDYCVLCCCCYIWHAINKGILFDWSTIYVVSVLISDEMIIMQRL